MYFTNFLPAIKMDNNKFIISFHEAEVVMDYSVESLKLHYSLKGKLSVQPKIHVTDRESLSLTYTPGVAAPCLEIAADPKKSYGLTGRENTVAVITDGTAVLGLGDIGPEASMPVMEGKCFLFKEFANIDAIPLCVRTKDVTEFVNSIALLSGSFGGINLEDISAPRCFEIETLLQQKCDIPVFHDDQHGTAVVVLAALLNACRLTGRTLSSQKTVICGAGAAGIAIMKLLRSAGVTDITMCDVGGIIHPGRTDLNAATKAASLITNPGRKQGTLRDALPGTDLFIGVSAPHLLTEDMIATMAEDPVIFALANPVPEIMPEDAYHAGAAIVGTGRSDYPNQINNLLAFPGIFKGALQAHASRITEPMLIAAAHALSSAVTDAELSADFILPSPLDHSIADIVADAVAKAVAEAGIPLTH